jgi:hypothetical protein
MHQPAHAPVRHSHHAAVAALITVLALAAGAGAPGCHRSTGIDVTLQLLAMCEDGSMPGPLGITSVRVDLAPCGPQAGSCSVTGPAAFLTGTDGFVVQPIEDADLSPMDPIVILLEGADAMPNSWVRVFATARNAGLENVATGWIDVFADQSGILRPESPLVLNPQTCGFVPDPDYDGDGFVATDDCNEWDPTVNVSATEICSNGVDDNCDGATDLDDDACLNPDADGDGLCAFGIDVVRPLAEVPPDIRALCGDVFTDCDDTDPLVGAHCACDGDADGFCDGPDFICPHYAALGAAVVCAPGGDCCNDATNSLCADIFPGAFEECDGIDNDCNAGIDLATTDQGVTAAEGSAACFGLDAVGGCEAGLYCPGRIGEAGVCHAVGYLATSVDVNVCEAPTQPYCTNNGGMTGGPLVTCPTAPVALTMVVAVDPGGVTTSCSWDVVTPTDPLVVTPSGFTGSGTSCASIMVDVDPTAVTVAGAYSFYIVGVIDFGQGPITTVYRFDVYVSTSTCPGPVTTGYTCTAG